MTEASSKVMTASEAISRFVHDGDQLVIGNYTVGSCAELVYEVARQKKKNLTLFSQSGIFDVEVLVGAGCVEKLITAYVMRAGGKKGGSAVERAMAAGTIQLEDYTNFGYNARLVAGMHGLTFMQVLEGVMAIQRIVEKDGVLPSAQRGGGKGLRMAVAESPRVVQVTVPGANQG